MKWSKQNAIEIYTIEEAYQVRIAIGQEEMASKQAETNVEIAGSNIPHTFFVGKIAIFFTVRITLQQRRKT